MSYLERLKKNTECPSCMLPKGTKGAFVGSGSMQTGTSPEISARHTFVELVRATGASKHQILLHCEEIDRELDEDDVAELVTLDRHDKQSWAEMLAYRLSKERLQGTKRGLCR